MLGQIQYIGERCTTQKWTLDDQRGAPFERHIYKVLSRHLSQFHNKVWVFETPPSRDDGKDIIIKSTIDLKNVLGHDFYLKNQSEIKIYVECKSSDSGKITWNQIAGNIARVENDNIQYYILVTNTTIVPYTYYQFVKAAKEKGIEFVLVDHTLLLNYLLEQNAFIGKPITPDAEENIYYEYQILSYEKERQTEFELYLLIRNYKKEIEKIEISLGTDHDWSLSPEAIKLAMDPNQYQCVKLIARRNYFDGINELKIIFELNHTKNVIEVKGMNLDFDFIAPLHGRQHYKIIDKLTQLIDDSLTLQVKYLVGEAGCGKTRIIEELYKKLSGRNIGLARIICTKNEEKARKSLINFLLDKDFLTSEPNNTSLTEIVRAIDTEFQKCVIFFDDIHNLTNLLSELQEVSKLQLNKPITIILVGRNDYSVGNTKYFSFLQWCMNRALEGEVLRKMEQEDSLSLISSIINDIPNEALYAIQKKSNCNPLFIIQFIEYLLELKLAHIINRTTVGILNIDTFSKKVYIPAKIEELYRDRCNILKTEKNGVQMLDFLYLVSFIGNSFPKEAALLYFEENDGLITYLMNRKFLSYTENGELCFFHETLYLFFKHGLMNDIKISEHIWPEIVKKFTPFLDGMDKGLAYFYIHNVEKALEYFEPVLGECRIIENYSAIKCNPKYYDYLDAAYELAKINKMPELQKNIIIYKIYTALHYYTPLTAVDECLHAADLISQNAVLSADQDFLHIITELKAHGYMNAGQLRNAEQYLTECLTISLLMPGSFNRSGTFDMYDRLSGLYIKYNHYSLADNYNKLSQRIAEESGDKSLLALTEITHAKLNGYINPELAKASLLNARKYLEGNEGSRTYCHNEISLAIQELPFHFKDKEWLQRTKSNISKHLNQSIENRFASSVIRSYLVLSALEFFSCDDKNFCTTEKLLSDGIDASIRYGIGTYIWEFYNLKYIIATKQHADSDYMMKVIETIRRMLKQQNLCYLGALDFCYANVLVLTNISKYLKHENEFYQFLAGITYNDNLYNSGCDFNCGGQDCVYVCEKSIARFKDEFTKIQHNKLLLMDDKQSYALIDEETGYYVALS